MDCIVTGFPSKLAALQFEWAWRNTHLTKRIAKEDRITKVPDKTKSRSGRLKIPRPKATLADKLKNLHLLLRVPSFARWPLDVRFFCEEIWQQWKRDTQNLDKDIRSDISIVLDLKQINGVAEVDESNLSTYEKGKRRRDAIGKGGVNGIDISFASFGSHLEKSRFLLRDDQRARCAVCSEQIAHPGHTSVVCPHGKCTAASHLTCLARRFLSDEKSYNSLLPTSGNCPQCNISTRWIDLIKEMNLRARGEKESTLLVRKLSMSEKPTMAGVSSAPGVILDAKDEDDGNDVEDDALGEDWLSQEDDRDDQSSIASATCEASTPTKPFSKRLPSVIEDSEWDEAEELD